MKATSILKTIGLGLGLVAGVATDAAQAADKYKIYLSMSYIGNDWQDEAAKMVKALAASNEYKDKVDLKVQVAGPNAQKQIQQINAMVAAGAKAIVVYPISPTALNEAVKAACDKGVVIAAYDGVIEEPCAYNTHVDQYEWGKVTAEWLAKKLNGKGNIVMITGVNGTSVDTLRNKAAREVFAQISGHQDRRRSERDVEPGGGPHRALQDHRDAPVGHDRRPLDAGGVLYRVLHAERVRHSGRQAQALRRRGHQRPPHPDVSRQHQD